jgi:LEA14-like dessication related protein
LRQTTGLLVAGWLLAGCAALGRPEPVRVNVIGIEPLPGESMELRMAVKLRIQNPNETALDFDGISLELDLRGSAFAAGVSAERGSVPRFGETVVTVPVSIPAFAAVRQALDLATHERPIFDYALRGRLAGAGFGGLRFESKGEIEMPQTAAPLQ